jgi:hypothetical protein
MALLLAVLMAGCGGGSDPILGAGGAGTSPVVVVLDTTAPRLVSVDAASGVINVPINRATTATFSEPMAPATLTSASPSTAAGTTFTMCSTATQGSACVASVAGVVTYAGNTATFKPDAILAISTWYKSTITASAKDLAGNALVVPPVAGGLPNPWSWQTSAASDVVAPTITATSPADIATNVAINNTVNATFSKAMIPATISSTSFTLATSAVPAASVLGTVTYDAVNHIATFKPSSNLAPSTSYTATVTNAVTDLAGNALVVPAVAAPNNPWTFTTAASAVPPVPLAINLGSAASFGIASRAGLTSTGVTVVNGDVALYPTATCTDSTGNSMASQSCLVKTYVSTTGLTVNGSIYFAGDPFDNGATARSVAIDLNTAWVEGKNKVDTQGAIAADEIGGKTFIPGVYHNANLGLAAGGIATLDAQNDPNAIFIFKVDSTFVDSGTLLLPTRVDLINGAQARNVWFVTGLDITIGSGTTWNGNILAGRTVTILDGSAVHGRVLGGASGAGAITLTGAASPSVTSITVP